MAKRQILGKVVVITGASSGIGATAARLLAARGARVILAARRAERLQALAGELEAAGGQALAVPTDVRDEAQCRWLMARAVERWGRVDVLVNNAGLGYDGAAGRLRPDRVREQVDVNLLGAIWCTNAAVPIMVRQGRGHIINIGSIAGNIGLPTSGVYCATKFALEGFSQSVRAELLHRGIDVSLLCPGFVATSFSPRLRAAGELSRRPGPVMSAEHCAGWIVRLIERPRRKAIITWPYHLVTGTSRLLPGLTSHVMALVGRVLVRRRG